MIKLQQDKIDEAIEKFLNDAAKIWKTNASHIAANVVTDACVLSGLIPVFLTGHENGLMGYANQTLAWAGVASYFALRAAIEYRNAGNRIVLEEFRQSKDLTLSEMSIIYAPYTSPKLTRREKFLTWLDASIEKNPILNLPRPQFYAQVTFQIIGAVLAAVSAASGMAGHHSDANLYVTTDLLRTEGIYSFGVVANLLLARAQPPYSFFKNPSLWIAAIFLSGGMTLPDHLNLKNCIDLLPSIAALGFYGKTVFETWKLSNDAKKDQVGESQEYRQFLTLALGCLSSMIANAIKGDVIHMSTMLLNSLVCLTLYANQGPAKGVAEYIDMHEPKIDAFLKKVFPHRPLAKAKASMNSIRAEN